MKSRDFVYWLQGFVELYPSSDPKWSEGWYPDAHQWRIIRAHLAMVFKHEIDPGMEPKEALQEIHDQGKLRPGLFPSDDFRVKC